MALKFSRLSRQAIRDLKVGQQVSEHGIVVERLSSGVVRYKVNVMVDGQRIHRVIGRDSEGVTREQAERAIEAFRTKAREGRLDLPSGRKTHRSFTEAAEEYLARLDETGGKNMNDKRRHLRRYLIPHFKNFRADRVTGFSVQQYVRKRLDAGAKQATVNRELASLSHLFNSLARWKWIKLDDRPPIQKGVEPRKRIVILSRDQQQALLRGALADQDGQTWLFTMIGLNSAMRHGEILRVRFDQIDFERNRIHIPHAKAGERDQPITASLAAILRQERDQASDKAGFVFPRTTLAGKHPHRSSMAKQFKRAVKRAGLEPAKVTPHVMRHTAITTLVQAGVDLPTIQKISGHKTLAMVLRYVHLTSLHVDTAIEALDTGVPGTITPALHTREKSGPLAVGAGAHI